MNTEPLPSPDEARIVVQLAESGQADDLEPRLAAFLDPYVAQGRAADGWSALTDAALALGRLNVAGIFSGQQIESNPGDHNARFNHGLILSWAEQYDAAQAVARELIDDAPDGDPGYQLMADIAQTRGDWQDMPAWWQKLRDNEQARLADHPLGQSGMRFLNQDHGILHRFGETATQLDPYIKMVKLSWLPAGNDRLIAPSIAVANPSYLSYWADFIDIVDDPDEINAHIELANELRIHTRFFALPDGQLVSKMQGQAAVQAAWQSAKHPPLLKLQHDHRARGRDAISQMGVPKDAWFACLHVRESGYLRPHEAEIHEFRDADIETYLLAVEAITAAGGWVIRLGDPTMCALPDMPQVIDYAHHDLRSDWLDVYLLGAAKFVLGTTSGPTPVAATFGTPVIMTNMVPHGERGPNQRSLFLPKIYRRREGDAVPFSEMLEGPMRWLWNGKLLNAAGLEAIDNSPQDIRDVTLEMMARLGDGFETSDADEALQQSYRDLFDRSDDFDTGSRIGNAFIRNYADLLQAK